jgi:mRNA interferase RelE/StbE
MISPPYRVIFQKRARKDFKSIPESDERKIRKAIDRLALDPRPTGSRAMHGPFEGLHRLRVGNYRVVYRIEDDRLVVFVIRLGSRQDIYQSLLRFLATLT